MIITIDGPIATGKSTIAKKLAETLGFIFFDTGAMYRAVTYAVLKRGGNFQDPLYLKKILEEFNFDIKIYHGEKKYFLDDEDISLIIRSPEVTAKVSEISALRAVRDKLVFLQREVAEGVNAVFEGRDMGSVVFPEAEIKIFLTASSEVRAKRRYEELIAKFPGLKTSLEKTLEEINKRDFYDMHRDISPLVQAKDAFVIDTSSLSTEDIISAILEYKDLKPTQS